MSKHRLDEAEAAEVEATLPRKKSKKDKKEKKERKEKKEKKEKKKDRKDKSEETNDERIEETPAEEQSGHDSTAPVVVEADGESVTKKIKKEKKKEKKAAKQKKEAVGEGEGADADAEPERKSKKEKKDKKEKKRKLDNVETNGTTNGHSNDAEKSSSAVATATPQVYEQAASLTSIPETEVATFLSTHQITITDPLSDNALRPIMEFSHLSSSALVSKSPFGSFKAPTPIQAASWPFGLSGRDIVGVAETGSGKTIAFGLPLITAVLGMSKSKATGRIRAVVVSPTRELAMQTNEQLANLGELVGLKTVCVYGGASKDDQRVLLRKADVIVATPGRLKDFLDEGSVKLDGAKFVVLDEADRMLDKGFEDDIKRIIGCTASKDNRQTLMFTATWPQSVQALASTFMRSPVKIQIGGNESGDLQANARIEQRVEVVDPRSKEQRLLQLLKAQPKNERVLVFCLYKKEATRVEGFLQQRGIKVVGIHGDLRQEQRTRSLEAFKTGQTPVLVATDVAARGLDIPEVKLVINVTFPLTIEDYVHRIGRTGRAGKTGHAITLFTEHDKPHSGELINILKAAGQPVPEELMKFGTTVKKKAHSTYGAFFKEVDMSQKGTKITFDD
ncbi:P-loop containing nucleoside triphosphate hydrolase protein [Biscogniauxia sp. FL1348]|nr:P-loop containing nucleoside triphosphate hydrolase protein [Biscogniauxia sp. FL1348]